MSKIGRHKIYKNRCQVRSNFDCIKSKVSLAFINEFFYFHLVLILGPDLPISLHKHSMVPLGLGQAILGGRRNTFSEGNSQYQSKIYHVTCLNHLCDIDTLRKELSVPRELFVAIPVPDCISGCISESKF